MVQREDARIRLGRPDVGQAELDEIAGVFETGMLTMQPYLHSTGKLSYAPADFVPIAGYAASPMALSIPDPSVTKDQDILVYDDVFTDGFTLREVARALIHDGGAQRVCGVTLTRQPWRR